MSAYLTFQCPNWSQARKESWTWVKIGYIPIHGLKRPENSKGTKEFADSGHDFAAMWGANRKLGGAGNADLKKDADYQACLDVIL